MEKRYISNRYKRVSSDKRKKRRAQSISSKLYADATQQEVKTTKVKATTKKRRKELKKIGKGPIFMLIICIIFLIFVIIRLITKESGEAFFDFLRTKVEEGVPQELNIGIVDEDVDLANFENANILSTELNTYLYGALLRVRADYSIYYDLLEQVEKISNSEYILKIRQDNLLTSSVLVDSLQQYCNKESKYYTNCQNISDIIIVDNKCIKIKLSVDDPLFIYNLQLPIPSTASNTGRYSLDTSKGEKNSVSYIAQDLKSEAIPKTITLTSYKEENAAINEFANGKLDMFITNDYSIDNKIGKTEFNIYSYKNGNCTFLLGNKNSEIFSKKEIRQAVAYSINRERIRKDIFLNSGSLIDIPYIYSDVKYKYDIYGAQNILLSNGYELKENIFFKEGKKVSLKLLVNKEDEIKLKIATYIKEDLLRVGIDVVIDATKDIEKKVSNGDFDILLANININENPNLSFLDNFALNNDQLEQQLKSISDMTNIDEMYKKIERLIEIQSNEITCIGIHADTTYLVCKKGHNFFTNISYMNLFTDILLTQSN